MHACAAGPYWWRQRRGKYGDEIWARKTNILVGGKKII